MNKLVSILLFGLLIQTFPQVTTFLKEIGLGDCYSVVQANDEGYLSAIKTSNNELEIIRTDKFGEVIWKKEYGLHCIFYPSIIKDNDGNFIILATKAISQKLGNLYLFKIDLQGDTVWTKTIESTECEQNAALLKTSDGGVIIYGVVTDSINSPKVNKQVVIKLSNTYTIEWEKTYSIEHTISFSNCFSIKEYNGGYIWITNKYLTKININGEIEWSKNLTPTQYSLATTSEGYILVGGSNKILKVNSVGTIILQKNFSGSIYCINPTNDGNFILATRQGMTKLNSDCDTLWSNIFAENKIIFVDQTSDGGYIGIKNAFALIKTNSFGDCYYIKISFGNNFSYLNDKYYFVIGESCIVSWEKRGVNSVKLEISSDDGSTWQVIEEVISDTSQYVFNIPNYPSKVCRLKITDTQNSNVFDITNGFTIGYNGEYDYFSANQIFMWIGDNGSGSHNPSTNGSGFYWPGGENATLAAIFQDGLIWGGKIDGKIYVNGDTHRLGLTGGPILEDGTAGTSDGIWKIKKDWQSLPAGPERDRYEYCYNNWPADNGAPYLDVNGDNKFSRGVDQPRFLGDEVLWFVANDLDTLRTQGTYGSDPIGLEIQLSTFGYNREDELGDAVFKKYKVINKSGKLIEDMYLSYWSDPDLGKADDDYVGCDTLLNLGFCYNGDNVDDNYYGENPPAFGYKLVQGPVTNGDINDKARIDDRIINGRKNMPMTSFVLYIGANDLYDNPTQGKYSGSLEFYYNFQGLSWRGAQYIDPNTNQITKLILSGDPVARVGWYEGAGWPGGPDPDDRRFLMSSGPFNLAAGDTQEVVYAIIMARGTDYLNSVTELKRKALLVQDFYDSHLPTNINTEKNIPAKFELYQNYPNPFNPSTTIKYSIPVVETGHAPSLLTSLKVYDVLGREVTTLVNEEKQAGNYQVTFDGSKLSSGVYFYHLKAGAYNSTKKLLLVK